MAKGATHVLGLDIGTAFIKAAEIQLRGDEYHVVGRPAVIPTPENAVRGGVVVDAPAVAEALEEIRVRYGAGVKRAVASVGGDASVVVRITEVPSMSDRELDEAIQWELDEQTPFPVDEVIYDYSPIERPDADPEATEMEVLLAVAQEDLVDAHVDAMQGAGMVPVAIDVEPLAIGRALVDAAGDAFADQTVVNVHIGATTTLILVFRHKLLSFVRVIPSAGENLTQVLAQNLMVDQDQAEMIKLELGRVYAGRFVPEEEEDEFAGAGMFEEEGEEELESDSVFELSSTDEGSATIEPDEGATRLDIEEDLEGPPEEEAPPPPEEPEATGEQASDLVEAREIVADVLTEPALDVATEVRKSLDFYRRRHRNEPVDRILVTGGSAKLDGLTDMIREETGVEATEVGNPFQYLTIDEPGIPEQYLRDIAPSMVIAVGLALRDMVPA
ncbi:MAG: type IV pilus assembly protein PilM [Armatimonadota bacterium]|nr:type IV pilus assembly protein PilM [Armatimonadota bacterium]